MHTLFRALFVASFVAACASCAVSVNADDPTDKTEDEREIQVLFIGNSYTYFNNLDATVKAMIEVSGRRARVERSTFGGWRLRQHFKGEVPKNNPNAIPTPEALKKAQWDYVVLQEQSCGPVDQRAEYLEYGKKMNDLVKENNPATNVLLYQTWGRCDGMFEGYGDDEARKAEVIAAFTKRYSEPNEATIEALKDGMQGGCARLAKETEAVVVPVGKAFQEVGDKVDLHANEKGQKPHHPSPAGTYLAACLFFKTITGESPVGLWKKLNAEGKDFKVGEEDAAYLERVADNVCK